MLFILKRLTCNLDLVRSVCRSVLNNSAAHLCLDCSLSILSVCVRVVKAYVAQTLKQTAAMYYVTRLSADQRTIYAYAQASRVRALALECLRNVT